jgi:hypothetical protein
MVARRNRSKLFYSGAVGIVLVIALAVGLGVGLSRKSSSNNTANRGASSLAADPASNTTCALSVRLFHVAAHTIHSGTTAVTPLAKWDWTKDKMVGMAIGNWLVLERWMYEDCAYAAYSRRA